MTLELKKIIEALLFSAERPLSPKDIRAIFADATDEEDAPGMTEPFRNVREAQIVAALEELKAECELQQHSYQLVEIAGGWRLVTRPEYAPWVKKLLDEARPHRLSPPSLETLAIIALRQPISRADIAAIRGVEVDGVVKTLLERDLITIVGKSDAPGRPMLYGTTQKFLEHFGLRDLDDMPKAAELRLQAAALKTAEEKASSSAKAAEDKEGSASASAAEGEAKDTVTPNPDGVPQEASESADESAHSITHPEDEDTGDDEDEDEYEEDEDDNEDNDSEDDDDDEEDEERE